MNVYFFMGRDVVGFCFAVKLFLAAANISRCRFKLFKKKNQDEKSANNINQESMHLVYSIKITCKTDSR